MANAKAKKTIDYYDRDASAWHKAHKGYTFRKKQIEIFNELLPEGKIVEFGSGVGKDAEKLISLGYDYTGIDASKNLLAIAKSENPKGKFKCMSLYDLELPQNSFDGFWAAAVLLHIPKSDIDKILTKVNKTLKPGAIGFVSMKAGAGEREDPETGRWFAFYSQKGFHEVLVRNGFEIIEEKTDRPNKFANGWWLNYWVKKS